MRLNRITFYSLFLSLIFIKMTAKTRGARQSPPPFCRHGLVIRGTLAVALFRTGGACLDQPAIERGFPGFTLARVFTGSRTRTVTDEGKRKAERETRKG